MKKEKDWYETWFDSPFYHILYQHRDLEEAASFIANLFGLSYLKGVNQVLDLACGKGRHAFQMSKYAPYVLGLDLSANSIAAANNQFAHPGLNFAQHDMREVYGESTFDLVCNLFTSFGYFKSDQENKSVFEAIYQTLKPEGYFVFDFMNTDKVTQDLVPFEVKVLSDIQFQITKQVKDGFILKDIAFIHEGQAYQFQEQVCVLPFQKVESWLIDAGFKIMDTFGDYKLNPYSNDSNRMIFIAQK